MGDEGEGEPAPFERVPLPFDGVSPAGDESHHPRAVPVALRPLRDGALLTAPLKSKLACGPAHFSVCAVPVNLLPGAAQPIPVALRPLRSRF